MKPAQLTIATLRGAYLDATLTPASLVERIAARTAGEDLHHVWVRALSLDEMMGYVAALAGRSPEELPLYGIPFAIKDNIDLAGIPTTAGCPAFAYTPKRHAAVVERLIAAGAIPVGKTNLDQFATGLSGTRSPYGACRNALDARFASGGSSSGSAVAVALGLATFALGTDTAGSGRVPAQFNGLIGMKPTPGIISTLGVVPACKSLDCVSIFTANAVDARRVLDVAQGVEADDPYARAARPQALTGAAPTAPGPRYGVPRRDQLAFFGNEAYARAFDWSLDRLRGMGRLVEIDFAPFLAAARLLYEGPWVAERYAAIRDFFDTQARELHPVTRAIIGAGRDYSAADVFAAQDRLRALRHQVAKVWRDIDVLVTPTSGTIHTVEDLQADPVALNSQFGYYTNFVNLLDMAAIAVPAGVAASGPAAGMPFGITFSAPAHRDAGLLALAAEWMGEARSEDDGTRSAAPTAAREIFGAAVDADTASVAPEVFAISPEHAAPEARATLRDGADTHVDIAVVGAHLAGQPLNGELTQRGARLIEATTTSADYRLYALPAAPLAKPGLVRVTADGAPIAIEVWRLPVAGFGAFVAGIDAPLSIGNVRLANGRLVKGFLCESAALGTAIDITEQGGWRAHLDAAAATVAAQ